MLRYALCLLFRFLFLFSLIHAMEGPIFMFSIIFQETYSQIHTVRRTYFVTVRALHTNFSSKMHIHFVIWYVAHTRVQNIFVRFTFLFRCRWRISIDIDTSWHAANSYIRRAWCDSLIYLWLFDSKWEQSLSCRMLDEWHEPRLSGYWMDEHFRRSSAEYT